MRNFTKIILGLLLIFTVQSGTKAQNLSVTDGAFYVAAPVTTQRLESHLTVENTASSPMSVMILMDKSQMVFGHQSYYCWFQCYDTTVTDSPDPLSIPGRSIDSVSFHSYLYPLGVVGTSTIKFTFFDQMNPADSASASIVYDVLNDGVDELHNLGTLAAPSPNPANNMTGISYSLPSLNHARMIIRNLLGEEVKSVELNSKEAVAIISTSDLKSGLYIYTLINDGRPVATQKLIVAHR